MSDRFEYIITDELAGIFVVDHGRSDMTIAVNIHSEADAQAIVNALSAGCE
jgi:hypothetical protein